MPVILFGLFALLLFPTDALAADTSLWSDMILFIRQQQSAFHRELASAIRAIQDGGVQAAWAMIGISFLYGVFHAAGPGHGKAVIGTYVLSHQSKLKQGIRLSFASAFMQGVSAIVIVEGLVGIAGWTKTQARDSVPYLESLSFGLIALIGIALMVRALKTWWRRNNQNRPHDHSHSHDHHHHEHEHDHDNHHHTGDHVCASCGHSHAPDPAILDRATSFKDRIAIILSVGIRPCSGSVLILIFAEILGLRLAGIGAVMAISLGTAITVSMLATLAVYFRKGALYLAARQSGNLVENLSIAAAFLGGLLICAMGVSLVAQSLNTAHPLF